VPLAVFDGPVFVQPELASGIIRALQKSFCYSILLHQGVNTIKSKQPFRDCFDHQNPFD
jgi:hypothetical protein